MYILKNAVRSILRTKGRNILIGIVICIIGIAATLGLAINSASQEVVNSQKESSEVSAAFGVDREALRNSVVNRGERIIVENISYQKIAEYMNSEFVKELRMKSSIGLNSNSIEAISSDSFFEKNIKDEGELSENSGKIMMGRNPNLFVNSDFEVIGYNNISAMSEFVNGTYKIIKGEIVDIESEGYECNINSELAQENSLDVGSKITFLNPNKDSETYEFVVKGIYEDTTNSENVEAIFSNSANKVIVSEKVVNNVVANSKLNDTTKLTVNTVPTIILKDVDSVEKFKEEVEIKGLPENYEIRTNEDAVNQKIKPIQNLTEFTRAFLVIVLIIGAIILIILNMINIRERKYEIGVLRAIGMKKAFVLSQFVIELFIVTVIAITIGTVIGSILSVPAAEYMLKNEIESVKTQSENIDNNFGGQMRTSGGRRGMQSFFENNTDIKYMDQINAVVDLRVLSQMLFIGLSLTILSSSISMVAISRYNPLKILSSRS